MYINRLLLLFVAQEPSLPLRLERLLLALCVPHGLQQLIEVGYLRLRLLRHTERRP